MDYRTQLINMVNEARNLPESELDLVPGTRIYVKKGRVKEFESNAYFYYKETDEQNLFSEQTYLEDVYKAIEEAISQEVQEYSNAKAAEIVLANQDAIERLRKVSENLATINTNYEKLSNQLLEIQKRGTVDTESLDKITQDIRNYAEYKVRATNVVANIKNEVNNNFVNAIKEQMEDIRNSFLTSPRGTEVGYGINGLSILASDKLEYDSLIGLLRLMNEINPLEEIVNVDGLMCVNKSQVPKAQELLANTKAFGKAHVKSLEEKALEANNKLIAEILKEKKHIEELIVESKITPIYEADNGVMVTPLYKDRYNNLLKALKYLNTANDRRFGLTPVWDGIAYVEGPDKDAFIDLMNNTEPFNAYNPIISQIEVNNKLIIELENYLVSLEREYNEYNGVTNIPSALTDNNTQIIDQNGNLEEYNNILKLINLLKDVNAKSLTNVYGIGNVKYDNIPEFKRLVSRIKKLKDRIPEPPQNKKETEKIKKRLEELNKTAQEEIKKDPTLKLADNGVVLERDLPEYKALIEKLRCLEASKGSNNLVPVNGAMIDKDFENSYKEAEEIISSTKSEATEKDFSANDAKLEEIEKIIQDLKDAARDAVEGTQPTEATRVSVGEVTNNGTALISSFKILNQDSDKFFALLDIKECLKNAKTSNNLIAIDGILIDNDDKDKYLEAMAKLKDIEKAKLENSDEKKLEKIKNNNAAHYPNLDADINRLQANGESEELNALLTIKNCLDNVKDVNNLQEFDGVMVDAADYGNYIEAITILDKIKNNINEHNKSLEGIAEEVRNKKGKNPESIKERKKDRKKVSVRKPKKEMAKTTLKRVALVGLGIAAMAPGLTVLAPSLVYAASSLGLGAVAELIASVASNVTMNNGIGYVAGVPIDATIAKVSAAIGAVTSLSTLGVISATAFGVSKWRKNKDKNNEIIEEEEKVKVIDKLKGLSKSIGKVKLPGSSLINSAKEGFKEGRNKAKEAALEKRKNKEKKNIQEQIAEEVAAEQQQGSENKTESETLGGSSGSAQSSPTNNLEELKDLEKKLLDLILKQTVLEESSPDYQNLQKEIDAVMAQMSKYGKIDTSKLFDDVKKKTEKDGTSSTATESATQEKPVVVVPPAQDILNNLSGPESETEKLLNWYNGCLEDLNSPYTSPEDKQIARQNLEEAKRRLKELGVEIPGEKNKEDIFEFTSEEQAKLDRWNIPKIDDLINAYEDAINKGGDVSKARNDILYYCGIYFEAAVDSSTFEVDYTKFGDRLEYILNLSDEDFVKYLESEIHKNNELLKLQQSSEITNRIIGDNEVLSARVASLRSTLNITQAQSEREPIIPAVESSSMDDKEKLEAERDELQRKIDAISDPNDLDRIIYESRLEDLEGKIASLGGGRH